MIACRKVFQTDFYCAKARPRSQALSIGVVFKSIAAMVRELCVFKNQNNKKTKRVILAVLLLRVWMIAR